MYSANDVAILRASARASATDLLFAAIVLAKMLSYTTVSSACVTAVDVRPAQSCAARADTVTVVSPIFIDAPSHVAVQVQLLMCRLQESLQRD